MYQQPTRRGVGGARVPLAVGAGRGAKVLVLVAGGVALGISVLFVATTWLAGGLASAFGGVVDDGPAPAGGPGPDVGRAVDVIGTLMRGVGLCAVPVLLLSAYLVTRAVRDAAWLEGTTAVRRGALTTRRVDLATAEVRGDAVTRSGTLGGHRYLYSIAAVTARDPRSGRELTVPLRGRGLRRLPADQLRALAAAIMTGRDPAGAGYAEAHAVASALARSAADPFPA